MSNQPLNPISYSQLIGWFAWNCHSKVKNFQNNFFHLRYFGEFDLYDLKKTVSKQFMKFRSWFESCWAAEIVRAKGLQHNDPIILASRMTKHFENSPLQRPEHVKLNKREQVLQKNSPKFHAKVNYSANVAFSSIYITKKLWTKKSSNIY